MKHLLPFLLLASFAHAQSVPPGTTARVVRSAPVFEKPSGKSKRVADVDPDTLVIIKRLSPNKTWMEVEDSDGNTGWIPRDRTDYFQAPPQQKAKKQKAEFEDEEEPPAREAPSKASSLYHHINPAWTRLAFEDPTGSFQMGATYTLFYEVEKQGQGADKGYYRMIGLMLGGGYSFSGGGFNVPIRIRSLSPFDVRALVGGPDIGTMLSFVSADEELGTESAMKASLGIGYTVGLMPRKEGFFLLLRGGMDFFSNTRFGIELQAGWAF